MSIIQIMLGKVIATFFSQKNFLLKKILNLEKSQTEPDPHRVVIKKLIFETWTWTDGPWRMDY